MTKFLLTAFLGLSCLYSFAQTDYNVFSAVGRGVATTFETDYHATGINPANLGFKRKYETKHVTFGLLEGGASAYSAALNKSDLSHAIFNSSNNFTAEQKQNAAKQFMSNPTALNADFNWLGISYQHDKIGGFAFNIRESGRSSAKFNQNFANILFLGYQDTSNFKTLQLNNGAVVPNNPSQYTNYQSMGGIKSGIAGAGQTYSNLFNGTKLTMLWYREFALSYGREFAINDDISITGGIGLKYLLGMGMTQMTFQNNKITSIGAYSPLFDLNLGTKLAASNPSSDSTRSLFNSAGNGSALDLGANFIYKEKFKFGVSVTNIGSINWKGNVYSSNNNILDTISTNGFNSYNFVSEADKIVSTNGILRWEGVKKVKTQLPTTLRIGGSYVFEEKAEVGFDVIVPLNNQPGALQKTYWAIGGDYRIIKFLKLSSGVAYGGNFNTRVNIPAGVTVLVGENAAWEFGVSTRDIVTYFKSNGPILSAAFGFLRFRV